MTRKLSRAATLIAILGAPTLALAAEQEEKLAPMASAKQGVVTGITALVVFAIVFAVLAVKVWPVITKALDERAAKIRSEIEAAEMAQKQAKAALEQYERSLADARAEAQKMINDAMAKQQALVAEQKSRAEQDIAQMRERARRDIEAARRLAVEEVYAAGVNHAAAMASKILRKEITPSDQQRLVEESLAELQSMGQST